MNRLKEVKYFQIRQTWLGLGYICRYNTKDDLEQIYDHDAVFQRNKKAIMNNKSWSSREAGFMVTDGHKHKISYKEKSLEWLPAEE
jgi:hypothetical protein